MNKTKSREKIKGIMSKYCLTCDGLTQILNFKKYIVYNWRNGCTIFKPQDEFVVLHKMREAFASKLKMLDDDIEEFNF